ncbi:MAG: type II toxin-antitoxin system HicA family toxin [Methanolobus sp.]|uniref:type II toxin-antitoxin system HicA family toxin n=1 Tax=Methanolobus sp. TaxID=1874737 RepID=UPI00272FE6EF|nr:type II toxin-antitoxin system HicA family toxin [Methanolobus sp.]MDP2218329.1 type II toxin-antitoxin system HicA family toxin [Methanolobus sp.]
MHKLTPVTHRNLVKRLRELEFEGPFSGAKHSFMTKGDIVLTIPDPHKDRISAYLLQRILKQANISREEWMGE